MSKHVWMNGEFIFIQTLDESGRILNVERIDRKSITSDMVVDEVWKRIDTAMFEEALDRLGNIADLPSGSP